MSMDVQIVQVAHVLNAFLAIIYHPGLVILVLLIVFLVQLL